ncbi:MAG: hypothetical protein ACI82S_002960 [Patiriisocius sp.]|jgi:hypothetical protein
MLRLTKRTWNNVLIFSMIGLILILNIDTFKGEKPTARLIVAEGDYIINLQINQVELEKAGPQWRIDPNGIQPNVMPNAEKLQEIIKAWQQAYITPAEMEFDNSLFSAPSTLVVISLAGVSQPTVVALNIIESQLFFVINKQIYVLNSPTIQQLLEPVVKVTQ